MVWFVAETGESVMLVKGGRVVAERVHDDGHANRCLNRQDLTERRNEQDASQPSPLNVAVGQSGLPGPTHMRQGICPDRAAGPASG